MEPNNSQSPPPPFQLFLNEATGELAVFVTQSSHTNRESEAHLHHHRSRLDDEIERREQQLAVLKWGQKQQREEEEKKKKQQQQHQQEEEEKVQNEKKQQQEEEKNKNSKKAPNVNLEVSWSFGVLCASPEDRDSHAPSTGTAATAATAATDAAAGVSGAPEPAVFVDKTDTEKLAEQRRNDYPMEQILFSVDDNKIIWGQSKEEAQGLGKTLDQKYVLLDRMERTEAQFYENLEDLSTLVFSWGPSFRDELPVERVKKAAETAMPFVHNLRCDLEEFRMQHSKAKLKLSLLNNFEDVAKYTAHVSSICYGAHSTMKKAIDRVYDTNQELQEESVRISSRQTKFQQRRQQMYYQ